MTSFERLVASDPQRDGAYAPRDLDAMISRVLAHPYARVLSWRAFKARILAGFTASCAVIAAAIYGLAGAGPSLVRLTFAAAAPVNAATAAPQKYATTATGSGYAAPRYVAGDVTTSTPSLAAFTVTAPSSLDDAVATLAGALGVRLGRPRAEVTPPGAPPTWTARGENGKEALVVRVGGVQLWGYLPGLYAQTPSAPSGAGAPRTSGGLSAAALAQRALDIVHALGTFDTGAPVVGTGGPFVRGEPTNVVVPIRIDGHWSNLTDGFFLDGSGRVISASGAMFSLGPPITYPLVSPRAAVAHISEQAAIFAHAVTPLGRLGYVPTGVPLTTGARLSTSSAQYRILVDAKGVGHALPIYQYVGRSADTREVVLDALAIDPRYLVYQVYGGATP